MGVAKKCIPQYNWNTAKDGMKHQSIEKMMYICILAITKLLLMRWRCLFCTIKLVFKSHLGHMIYDCLRPLIYGSNLGSTAHKHAKHYKAILYKKVWRYMMSLKAGNQQFLPVIVLSLQTIFQRVKKNVTEKSIFQYISIITSYN